MYIDKRGTIFKRADGSEIINYDNSSFPAYIHNGFIKPESTWANVPHYHEDLEFIYIISGQMGYNVNAESIILNVGESLMINSNQIHYSIWTQPEICRYIIYIVHPRILCSSYIVESEWVDPITDNKALPYIHFKHNSIFAKRMETAAKDMLGANNNEFQITRQFFNVWDTIWAYCNKLGNIQYENHFDDKVTCIKKMLTFIHNEYASPIKLADICDVCNISKTYCNQLFNTYTGMSPIEHLLRYRCDKIAEYLTTTDMTLSEISERTGFSGQSYMTETFKKFYKLSPRDYRKAYKLSTLMF